MGSIGRSIGNVVSAPFRAVANVLSPPKATSSNVTNITQGSNFDPSGLQAQIDALKNQASSFSAWQTGRQQALGGEAAQRAENRALVDALQSRTSSVADQLAAARSGLGGQIAGLTGQVGGLGNQLAANIANTQGLQSDFQGLGSQVSGLSNVQQQLRSGLTSAQAGLRGLGDTVTGQRGDIGDLANQLASQGATLNQTGTELADLGAGFDRLTADQRNQISQLYNLAAQGKGVQGVKTSQGLTFTQPRGVGTGALNRDALTFGSLNLA